MNILFANNARTTLNDTLLIAGTTAVVSSATNFPSPTGSPYFYATIQNPADDTDFEIVKCTAVSGVNFTIEREQEGTSAQEWAVGSLFELRLTAGGIDDLSAHQLDHIKDGYSEIDGDKLDIDWNPSNYTPTTTPDEVDHIDHLAAHLAGLDARVAIATETSRGTIELATTAEAQAFNATNLAITPKTLADALKGQSWMQDDGYYIATDKIRARDSAGLRIEDDGGNGFTVLDGGRTVFDNPVSFKGSFMTKGSPLAETCLASAGTLYLDDTTDFDSSGDGWIIDSANDRDAFSWTGKTATTLTGCTGVLAHTVSTSNKPLVIPQVKNLVFADCTNELRFFGDRGDGTIEELGSIGITQSGSDYFVAKFGSLNAGNSRIGVTGNSYQRWGVCGLSVLGNGVTGSSTDGPGGYFDSVNRHAIHSGGSILFDERSSDPPSPNEGQCVLWMSDGTGSGDDGDIMMQIKRAEQPKL
jgi:hypothetical protein